MKVNLDVLSNQQTSSTSGSKQMRLSANASAMVFQMFTKNVYSNPIGTIVREIMSNCFDSHVEANVNKPVIVKKSIDKQTGTIYISFIDFGVGMSPDRVENIYMVYFESSKRQDNTQIGGFGIGGKTPLAYRRPTGKGEGEYDNSFFVITNFNGTKYYYCIYEGASSPEVSLIHSEPTDEHNGTEVRIPVLERDLNKFKKEMVRQLYYFENIIFEGFNDKENDAENNGSDEESEYDNDYDYVDTTGLTNKYQIIRGKSFWYRGDLYDGSIHVCLGRVAYPIDYNILDLNSYDYRIPVAIKLEVGDIGVTASRESLDYSEKTIKLLKKKLAEVKAEVVGMLTSQYKNVQTLEDYFKVKETWGILIMPNGDEINISSFVNKNDVDYTNFKYSFMKIPSDREMFEIFFEAKLYGKKGRGRRYRRDRTDDGFFENDYKDLMTCKNLYYVDGNFKRKLIKQAWLKEKHERYYLITKVSLAEMSIPKICDAFNVSMTTKYEADGKPTTHMNTLLEMQEEYFAIVRRQATDYDKIDVPADFTVRRNTPILSAEYRNTTIPVKIQAGYYSTNTRVKVEHLLSFRGTIIYGYKDDDMKLRNVRNMYETVFPNPKVVSSYQSYSNYGFGKKTYGIIFLQIAQNNAKYLEYCHKAYHVTDAYWKLLHRQNENVLNYFRTYKIKEKYFKLPSICKATGFAKIDKAIGNDITILKTYVENLPRPKRDWSDRKQELSSYYKVFDVETTPEQKEYMDIVDSLDAFYEKNKEVLQYINLPYGIEDEKKMSATLVNILKQVLVF